MFTSSRSEPHPRHAQTTTQYDKVHRGGNYPPFGTGEVAKTENAPLPSSLPLPHGGGGGGGSLASQKNTTIPADETKEVLKSHASSTNLSSSSHFSPLLGGAASPGNRMSNNCHILTSITPSNTISSPSSSSFSPTTDVDGGSPSSRHRTELDSPFLSNSRSQRGSGGRDKESRNELSPLRSRNRSNSNRSSRNKKNGFGGFSFQMEGDDLSLHAEEGKKEGRKEELSPPLFLREDPPSPASLSSTTGLFSSKKDSPSLSNLHSLPSGVSGNKTTAGNPLTDYVEDQPSVPFSDRHCLQDLFTSTKDARGNAVPAASNDDNSSPSSKTFPQAAMHEKKKKFISASAIPFSAFSSHDTGTGSRKKTEDDTTSSSSNSVSNLSLSGVLKNIGVSHGSSSSSSSPSGSSKPQESNNLLRRIIRATKKGSSSDASSRIPLQSASDKQTNEDGALPSSTTSLRTPSPQVHPLSTSLQTFPAAAREKNRQVQSENKNQGRRSSGPRVPPPPSSQTMGAVSIDSSHGSSSPAPPATSASISSSFPYALSSALAATRQTGSSTISSSSFSGDSSPDASSAKLSLIPPRRQKCGGREKGTEGEEEAGSNSTSESLISTEGAAVGHSSLSKTGEKGEKRNEGSSEGNSNNSSSTSSSSSNRSLSYQNMTRGWAFGNAQKSSTATTRTTTGSPNNHHTSAASNCSDRIEPKPSSKWGKIEDSSFQEKDKDHPKNGEGGAQVGDTSLLSDSEHEGRDEVCSPPLHRRAYHMPRSIVVKSMDSSGSISGSLLDPGFANSSPLDAHSRCLPTGKMEDARQVGGMEEAGKDSLKGTMRKNNTDDSNRNSNNQSKKEYSVQTTLAASGGRRLQHVNTNSASRGKSGEGSPLVSSKEKTPSPKGVKRPKVEEDFEVISMENDVNKEKEGPMPHSYTSSPLANADSGEKENLSGSLRQRSLNRHSGMKQSSPPFSPLLPNSASTGRASEGKALQSSCSAVTLPVTSKTKEEEKLKEKGEKSGRSSTEDSGRRSKWGLWKWRHLSMDSTSDSRADGKNSNAGKTAAEKRKISAADEQPTTHTPLASREKKTSASLSHFDPNPILSAKSTESEASTHPLSNLGDEPSDPSPQLERLSISQKEDSGFSPPTLDLAAMYRAPPPLNVVKKLRPPEEDLLSDISSAETSSIRSSSFLISPTVSSRNGGRNVPTYWTNHRDVLNEIEQERNRLPPSIEEEIFVYDDIVIRKDDARAKHWRIAGRKSLFEPPPCSGRSSWGGVDSSGRRSADNAVSSSPGRTTFSFNDFDICVDEMDISLPPLGSPSERLGSQQDKDTTPGSSAGGSSNEGGPLPFMFDSGTGSGGEMRDDSISRGSLSRTSSSESEDAESTVEEKEEEKESTGETTKRMLPVPWNGVHPAKPGAIMGNTVISLRKGMIVTWTQTPLSQRRRPEEIPAYLSSSLTSLTIPSIEGGGERNKGDTTALRDGKTISSPGPSMDMLARLNGGGPREITNFQVKTLLGHPTRVKCLSLSPTEKEYVSCSNEDASVMLSSFAVGTEVGIFTSHQDTVICTAFSPDGKLLATTSKDRCMKLWDVMTTKLLLTYNHSKVVICCCFSPDSRYVVSGCQDRVCRLWDTRRGKEWLAYAHHDGIIIAVCFSPDSQFVCSASADCTLRVWASGSAKTKYTLSGHKGIILSCSYTTDGTHIISNDESQLRVWSTADGTCKLVLSPDKVAGSNSFKTPYGDQRVGWTLSVAGPGPFTNYVIVACNNRYVYVIDRVTGEEVLSVFCKAPVYCLSSGWKELVAFGDNLGNIYMLKLL